MFMVPRTRGTMDTGWGTIWTYCVNQHIFNSEMINKKVIFNCRNIHFRDIEIKHIYNI